MDSVKVERVSPVLQESGFSDASSGQALNGLKAEVSEYYIEPQHSPSVNCATTDCSSSNESLIQNKIISESVNINQTVNNNDNSKKLTPLPPLQQPSQIPVIHAGPTAYSYGTSANLGSTPISTHCATSLENDVSSVINSQSYLDSSNPLLRGLGQMQGDHAPINENISDAVTKILKDYDWSQIPLANNDRRKVHVKRPMNAFMVWAQEARRRMSGQHRQVHNAELSKSLGKIWREMSDDKKRPFVERADFLRKKHKQEYPDYKYQPRRRKDNVKSVNRRSSSPQDISAAQNNYNNSMRQHSLLALHSISPPHSPSGSRESIDQGAVYPDNVLVNECLADSFDTIDRTELNKYLIPDQPPPYPASSPNSMTSIHSALTSRLAPPIYVGSNSTFDIVSVSPGATTSSSDGICVGSTSPSTSPDPPNEYVELQPPRVLKDDSLPSINGQKTSMHSFLPQNVGYLQHYPTYNYSYSNGFWQG